MRAEAGGLSSVKVAAVVFVGYAAGATLSLLAFGATVGPAFFPPAGITVAALLLSSRRMWPAILAATALAELVVDLRFGDSVAEAAAYAVANSMEPLVGASLVRFWCGAPPDLRQRRQLMLFIAGACLAGPLLGGLLGGSFIALRYGVPFPTAVVHWLAGDAIGVLVVAVPILLWSKQFKVIRSRPWETVAILAIAAALASLGAIWAVVPRSVLILPVLAWAALRLDMLGAALAGTVVAFAANLMTISGHSLFSFLDVPEATRLALAQLFIAVNLVTALLIAQEAAARTKAVREHKVERRERLRLVTLARLAQQLAAALTPKDIGRALEDQVLNDAGATALSLGLVSQDHRVLQWVRLAGHPVVAAEFAGGIALSDRTVGTDAVRTGQPVVMPTSADYAESYPDMERWRKIAGTETAIGWPLVAGGDPFGVLVLAWSKPQPLDPAQLAYVSAVATMVGQALVRARVYEDEHARAAVLQSAVLPALASGTPGLDVCATYEPADLAQAVGGDWYDVMTLSKGRTYFAVGDVVGHGLPAVEDMAQLRAAGRTLAHLGLPPGQFLAELNGLTRDLSQGKFATMAVAVFDPAAGSLSYGLAGHPPLLLRRRTGEVVRLSEARGPVLGPVRDVGYAEATVSIDPGDILVMYTDGLVENREEGLDAGISRAQKLIEDWDPDTELTQSCRALQETLAPRPRPDDVCLIVVRFGGTGGFCVNC